MYRVFCNNCRNSLTTQRYICIVCKNFDLCQNCESIIDHAHPLLKITQQLNKRYEPISLKNKVPAASFKEQIQQFKNNKPQEYNPYADEIQVQKYSAIFLDQNFKLCKKMVKTVFEDYNFTLDFYAKNIGEQQWPNETYLGCINGEFLGIFLLISCNLACKQKTMIHQANNNNTKYQSNQKHQKMRNHMKHYDDYTFAIFKRKRTTLGQCLTISIKILIVFRMKVGIIVRWCNETVKSYAKLLKDIYSGEDINKILLFCQAYESVSDLKQLVGYYEHWQVDQNA